MNSDSIKKYKRLKQNTVGTTNPVQLQRPKNRRIAAVKHTTEPLCPLLAKDSEWVDILETDSTNTSKTTAKVSDEEEVLQLVECEDGLQMKPLAIMFPGLLEEDPETLEGMFTRTMSTTEVTRHLVNLGQKANLTFMKKADRLIPLDKQWMETLTENSNSYCSVNSSLLNNCESKFDYETNNKGIADKVKEKKIKKVVVENNNQSQKQSNLQVLDKKKHE